MIRGRVVLFVVAQFIVCSEGKKIMKKAKDSMDDEVRLEYDLKSLRVRKVGTERKSFGGRSVRLGPDVAALFPDSESVNEALRILIRITREHQ